MGNLFSDFTINKKLAAAALVFALAAAVISDPQKNENTNLNLNLLASEIENAKDHVEAVDLADWIMQKRNDYLLIDIRDKKSFDEYHIPNAVNMSLQKIANWKFDETKKIIVYSDGGTHGSQAWFFIKSMGYKDVYFLRYGLNEWIDDVIFPKISKELYETDKDEFLKFSKKAQFFGGEVELSDSLTIAKKTYRREGC